jgi:hypothetical protein
MQNRVLCLCLLLIVLIGSRSYGGNVGFEGDMSLWWSIYEENENGILQTRTETPAADVVSGFSLKQGRVSLCYEDTEKHLGVRFQLRLEERIALLDGYGIWRPSQFFHLYLGQMKVPSTYESLASDAELDFISRSTLSRNLTDWSLSRAPYYSALYGISSHNRDLGVAVKGELGSKSKPDFASYFLMVGNGLGANLYIGGTENKEFMFSNKPGDYFYGARLDISPSRWMSFGGHYSLNKHDNMLFNDEKTVFDLDRYSWSVDSRIEAAGARLVGMYGTGRVDDNYFYTAEKDLEYTGYEVKLLFWLIRDRLQLGARYDVYSYKFLRSGLSTDQNNLTFGVNLTPAYGVRLQLNYVLKNTDNEADPDLDDNILFLNFQYSFNTGNML